MKISNKFITSIPCYRRHFDFKCVWGQLGAFIRDMSPESVYYPDAKSKKLYEIITDPSRFDATASDINKVLFSINGTSILDSPELDIEKFEDRVRILALFELAEIVFDVNEYSNEIHMRPGDSDIVLTHGQSLNVEETETEIHELLVRQIRVDSNSATACTIGGHKIAPGDAVYGVFSKNKLHHVIEPVVSNQTYKIYLAITHEGPKTIVESREDRYVRHLEGVISFCTVGDDDYAYISNGRVYSGNDPHLTKKLGSISIFDTPIIVQSDDVNVHITMADGSKKSINHTNP